MKYSFALAAIVAIASAQSEAQAPSMEFCEFVPDDPACNPVVPKPEPTLAEKLFEKNEDGQFQLAWPGSKVKWLRLLHWTWNSFKLTRISRVLSPSHTTISSPRSKI